MIPAEAIAHEDGSWTIPVSRRALPKRDAKLAETTHRAQGKFPIGAAKGEVIVSPKKLTTKLGKTTFRVWCALLTIRAKNAEVHPSMPGLAKIASMSERQVKKSLDRLRDFKLVEDYGFMYRQVPCRCPKEVGYHEHKIWVRRVYGVLMVDSSLTVYSVLVPRQTAKLIEEAAGQGGARAGAGRPKGKQDSQPRRTIKGGCRNSKGSAYKYQEPISIEETTSLLRNAPLHGECVSSSQEAEKDSTPALSVEVSPLQPEEVSMPSPLQPQAATADAPALSAMTALVVQPMTATTAVSPVLVEVDGRDGVDLFALLKSGGDAREISLGGEGRFRPQQRYTADDLRTASALSAQIEVLPVPAPPKVDEGTSDSDRLQLLNAALHAAHSQVLRKDFWRRGKATAKEQQLLLEAAEALRAEGIRPHVWAKFSLLQWAKMKRDSSPTPRWVWSAQRIHEHADWCRTEIGGLQQVATMHLPAGKVLVQRLAKLRAALGYGRPAHEVLAEILPNQERRVLLAQQASQKEAHANKLLEAIRNGEWVWG